ncbi:MAG: hypothetical protein ACYCQK_01275 [Acidiferrobacteraceae bacterium]
MMTPNPYGTISISTFMPSPTSGFRQPGESWDSFLDRTLRAWLRDPDSIADIGIDRPTEKSIRHALELCERRRVERPRAMPIWIVPNPDGEIVVEFEHEEYTFDRLGHLTRRDKDTKSTAASPREISDFLRTIAPDMSSILESAAHEIERLTRENGQLRKDTRILRAVIGDLRSRITK